MRYLFCMRRRAFTGAGALLLFLGLLPCLWSLDEASYAFSPTWAIVSDSHVRVREGPGVHAKELAAIDKGFIIHLDKRSDRKATVGKLKAWWYHADIIDKPSGIAATDTDGWIFGAYLALVTQGSDAALLKAISAEDEAAVKTLLKTRVNPNARTASWVSGEGESIFTYTSALMMALNADELRIAELLVGAGADVNARVVKPGLNLAVVAVAAQMGYWDLVHLMLGRKAVLTPDVAAAAIAQGNPAELLWTLGHGVSADSGVKYGPYDGNSLLNVALKADKVELARLLFEHGASVNVVANDPSGGKDDSHAEVQLVSMDTYGQSGVAQDVSPDVKAFLEEHYPGPLAAIVLSRPARPGQLAASAAPSAMPYPNAHSVPMSRALRSRSTSCPV